MATRGRPGSTSMTHSTPLFCEYDWSSRTVSRSGRSGVGWRSGGRDRTKSRNVRTIWPARCASSTSSVGALAQVGRQARVAADQRAQADDRGDRVVQLVGHARDEDPDRLHLLGLDELGLEPLALGQVADDDQVAGVVADPDPGRLALPWEAGPVRATAHPVIAASARRDRRSPAAAGPPLRRGRGTRRPGVRRPALRTARRRRRWRRRSSRPGSAAGMRRATPRTGSDSAPPSARTARGGGSWPARSRRSGRPSRARSG